MNTTTVFKSAAFLAVCALGMQTASAQTATEVTGNKGAGTLFLTAGNGNDDASHLSIAGPDNTDRSRIAYMSAWTPGNPQALSHQFYVRQTGPNDFQEALNIRQSGQVQIGLQRPSSHPDYKLSVDGKLVAKSIYVTNPTTWADFVFEPTYKRMALPELETYLLVNKHLPAVPSAKEVEANGYSVNEMDAKLLQSIEELTLHVIELSKQNQSLQEDVAKLKAAAVNKANGVR